VSIALAGFHHDLVAVRLTSN